MLTHAQEKLIKSLHTKKGRQESGLCLVEGEKVIAAAGTAVEWAFTENDTKEFAKLVATETPQGIAAVARIPAASREDLEKQATIVALDGVQDPGNVGAILRLCQGFGASLLLIESSDPANPKVVRASAGALFHVAWMRVSRDDAVGYLRRLSDYQLLRLEKTTNAMPLSTVADYKKIVLIVGSEGRGIRMNVGCTSVAIAHDTGLESLNVSHALAIALYERSAV